MTQWGWLGHPVTPRRTATSANDISAGRAHFDCVSTMILLRILLCIFITVFFFCFVASTNDVFANSFLTPIAALTAGPSVELFFGQLANHDDEQDYHQDGDHRPDPHSSARPPTHPSVSVVHHKKPLVALRSTRHWKLSTTAAQLFLGLRSSRCGQERLPAVIAAKGERLSIAFGVERGGFVHGHSADRVLGH